MTDSPSILARILVSIHEGHLVRREWDLDAEKDQQRLEELERKCGEDYEHRAADNRERARDVMEGLK